MSWLVLCSLFFYGWWNPSYLYLILFSMIFNYAVGMMLGNGGLQRTRKYILAIGVAINLGLLGYYKYANFFVKQVNEAFGSNYHLDTIILPLAISFFTFQQVAFLVDAYHHETKEYNFLHYCLFVTFFPQLIAGPIVHHGEMLPQFSRESIFKFNYKHISVGLFIFTIGLFKKVIFADHVSAYATPVFSAAEIHASLTFFEAWGGALAYTLQLYFDFSGYSDMAIGIAYMFGIKIPINFNSPYKSANIIEFWRRWHITLSRFLRDYLYFALGGNRKGKFRRYMNLFLTMFLGGIWHGAGWTFILWGMLHGIYLIINHIWRKIRFEILKCSKETGLFETITARTITLLAVIIGWVYFRAETVSGANHLVVTMFGGNGISLPTGLRSVFGDKLEGLGIVFKGMFGGSSANFGEGMVWIAFLSIIAIAAPNSQQFISPAYQKTILRINRKIPVFGIFLGTALYYIFINLGSKAEFLYFNF